MIDPTLELQGAIVAQLKAALDPEVGVYDSVPSAAVFPYVSIGPSDDLAEDAECIEGHDITLQLDVWSQRPGFREARTIAHAVRRALRDELEVSENALVLLEHRQTRVMRDPDGLTSHAAITFTAFVEGR